VSVDVLQLIGFDRAQAEQRVDDIIQLEVELATISCKEKLFVLIF